MISHQKHNLIEDSLFPHIQLHSPLLISTDWSKVKRKSGGCCVIALDNGQFSLHDSTQTSDRVIK